MKPKDLQLAPDELGAKVLEWSLLRNWVKSWLDYVHWYYAKGFSPEVGLRDFFNAPCYERSWCARAIWNSGSCGSASIWWQGRAIIGVLLV